MRALLLALLAACAAFTQTTVPLASSFWTLNTCNVINAPPDAQYCWWPDYTAPLSNNSSGDLTFTFSGSRESDNYLTTAWTAPLTGYSTASITVSTTILSGTPIFVYYFETDNTCVYPAHVRLYFEVQGDNWIAPNYRWWSDDPYSYELDLMQNSVTISVPLSGSNWSNVDGTNGAVNPTIFAEALASPERIGVTFGGGCFFGHGVDVPATSGQAGFVLSEYTLQ